MFFPESQVKIWLCSKPTDMRKSFDGLAALAKNQMHEDPLSGHLFVFINRRKTHVKILYFDRSGYCLWMKRLEQGRFNYDSKNRAKNNELLNAQLREIIAEQAEKIQSLEQQLSWFKRQIFGEKSTQRIQTTPAPANVLDKSFADVSFLVGLIKAGRKKKGKMNKAYFWPIYGEQDEICFTFSK